MQAANFGVFSEGLSTLQYDVPLVCQRFVAREAVELNIFRLSGEGCALRDRAIVAHVFGEMLLVSPVVVKHAAVVVTSHLSYSEGRISCCGCYSLSAGAVLVFIEFALIAQNLEII